MFYVISRGFYGLLALCLAGILWWQMPAYATTASTDGPTIPWVKSDGSGIQGRADAELTSAGIDCVCNLLLNSTFEGFTDWLFTPIGHAFYTSDKSYTGTWSAHFDTKDGALPSIWQEVAIPADATALKAEFWSLEYLDVGETVYLNLYDKTSNALLWGDYLIYDPANPQTWNIFSIDLPVNTLAGHTILFSFQIQLDTDCCYSDVYFDDATLWVTRPDEPTPTPTDTPTRPTDTPTATSIPPTATPTATNPPPTATHTPVPPTATSTPVPPTATSTPVPDEYEPNNNCTAAKAISASGLAQDHSFTVAADVDWARFDATADVTYRVEAQIPGNSSADVNLELYSDCNDAPDATWNATFTAGARLDLKPAVTGPVYVRVTNTEAGVAGANVTYRLMVRPLLAQQAGALIILAGRYKVTDQLQPNIHHVTDAVYSLFQAKGYTNNEIYYLTTDPNRPGYDAPATLAQLRTAITQWARDKVSAEKALTLYLMDHGNKDKFFVDRPSQEELTPAALDAWLTELETAVPGVKINIMIEACNSGSFITGVERVSKPGRVVITSTSEQNLAYASARGAHFSDHFVTALHQGQHLFGGFWEAQTAVRQVSSLQEPWLDGDGDGIANEPEDNAEATKRSFGIGALGAEDDWAPYIAKAAPVVVTNQQGVIQAEVRDDQGVEDVWAVIYPPSYVPPPNAEELTPETLDTIKLLPQGNGLYAASYRAFTETGRYRIVIQSDDGDNLEARPLTIEVVTGSKVYLPVVRR